MTVVGPDLATADAYATAAFAMGAGGPAWTATLTGYDAMCVTTDRRVLATAAFPAILSAGDGTTTQQCALSPATAASGAAAGGGSPAARARR